MEQFEQHLADESLRHEFYARLKAFSRCLHISLSSDKLFDVFDEAKVDALKRDWKQFSELKRSVQLRYQETVDVREFEPKIQKLLNGPGGGYARRHSGQAAEARGMVTRQQRHFAKFLPRTPERRFVAGETHLYLGRQYRLKVVPHVQESVKLVRGFIVVQTHQPTRSEVTRELVKAWYRHQAHIKFPERIELCLGLFPDPEAFRPKGLIVRQTGSGGALCRRQDVCC